MITSTLGFYLNLMAWISPKTAGRHGFNIFCFPMRSKVKTKHKEFLNTAEKFNFQYDGKSIQAYKWGRGPKKVLFVHGWKSHTYFWKSYIESLPEEDFTIYSIDAPGHGLSEGKFLNVPYYSHLIEQFINSIDSVDTVVSHSIGSFSMLYLLYTKPDIQVKSMVVLAPPKQASDFFEYYRNLLKLSKRSVRLILNHFEKAIKKPISYFSTERLAAGISIQGLIIHDINDDETPYESAVKVYKAWNGSEFITTEGLGHKLKSEEVVNKVKDFIIEQNLVTDEIKNNNKYVG